MNFFFLYKHFFFVLKLSETYAQKILLSALFEGGGGGRVCGSLTKTWPRIFHESRIKTEGGVCLSLVGTEPWCSIWCKRCMLSVYVQFYRSIKIDHNFHYVNTFHSSPISSWANAINILYPCLLSMVHIHWASDAQDPWSHVRLHNFQGNELYGIHKYTLFFLPYYDHFWHKISQYGKKKYCLLMYTI